MELDTVTINSEVHTENIIELVEKAIGHFPVDIWDSVQFKGNVKVPNDSKLLLNGKIYQSHLINKLIFRLRRLKERNPLLGITENPVYYLNSHIANGKLELILVHDYMDKNVGVVSLFYLVQDTSSKVIAHALGHNRNLEHHEEPIDIMYKNLVYSPNSLANAFCKKCVYDLKKNENL